ncbi:MAG: hypothetical protein HYY15_02070 [Candidatus Omnitrophica bacterium]|nr:hypothetical protein [Candidatus Omnitrophota bacterium]
MILVTCNLSLVTAEAAHVEYQEELPIVFLEGSPYELGRQHGELLREEVRQCVAQVLSYFRRYLKVPLVNRWAADWWLDRAWAQGWDFLPEAYREELRGLAQGSGVPLRELARLHAIPDRTYSCANVAAWGRATSSGRLVHSRNLDWNIEVGLQQFAAVFVVKPSGRRAFVNAGWAGFIGVLTGINDQAISIGQVGAETDDISARGIPMVFLMRRVLEDASALDQAVEIIRTAPRTVGVNYVIAQAEPPRAVAVETTHRQAVVFQADDPKEAGVSYARPVPDAVLRADTAMDPGIRARQIASGGDPKRPGLEPPSGSAYEVRYLGQAAGLMAHYGRLDAQGAMQIAQAVAPGSNMQSVVFAWPDMWVANAQGMTRAAQTPYHRLNVEELLRRDD